MISWELVNESMGKSRGKLSWGCLVYSALHFGEQSTLLVSPGVVWQTEVQPAVLSQLLQNPTNHYLGMINFCTSAVNEICIRVTAVWCNIMLNFMENQGPGSRACLFSAAHGSSWNNLVNAVLECSEIQRELEKQEHMFEKATNHCFLISCICIWNIWDCY